MEHGMNKKTVVSVILAMTMASSGLAFGQGNSGHNDRGNHGNDRGRNEQSQHGGSRHDDRRPDYRDNRGPDRHDDRAYHDNRGAGPNNSWHRGERIPAQYRSHQYVVDDWRGHRLSAPPHGYHWVQSGGDYLLVAVATGVILQLMLSN
jgi:Ni/Co efflux regulator RcnB